MYRSLSARTYRSPCGSYQLLLDRKDGPIDDSDLFYVPKQEELDMNDIYEYSTDAHAVSLDSVMKIGSSSIPSLRSTSLRMPRYTSPPIPPSTPTSQLAACLRRVEPDRCFSSVTTANSCGTCSDGNRHFTGRSIENTPQAAVISAPKLRIGGGNAGQSCW